MDEVAKIVEILDDMGPDEVARILQDVVNELGYNLVVS